MVVRISDKTQNYSKVTKLLVKPFRNILKENNVKIVTASDAHYPNDVGRCFELLDPR